MDDSNTYLTIKNRRYGQRLCLILLRSYQLVLSPLFPQSCRFTPTCSQYAIEAVRLYGTFTGLFMAARRIMRCHPWNKGGYDPVKGVRSKV
ncbi:MAG: membrane protein insertion efficiency factor YidD [Thermodesulfobacteriota bacterium]